MKKRTFLKCLGLLAVIFSLCSCESSETYEVDYAYVGISVTVFDSQGNDLLDSDFSGNILSNTISLTYQNVEYSINSLSVETKSLAPATFSGLSLTEGVSNHYLRFGEFEGTADYDMTMTLNIGDDRSYELRFVQDFEYADYATDGVFCYVTNEYYIDGEAIEGPKFTIVI